MKRLLEIVLNAEGTIGGEQRHVLQLLDAMDRQHFCPEVLTWDIPSFVDEVASRGVRVEAVAGRRILDVALFRHIESFIRQGGFDLVHAHGHRAGLLGRAAAIRAATPFLVWTCHLAENKADKNPLLRQGYRGALRYLDARTDATIAVSGLLGDWLASQGIDRDHIAVIPNGVDCSVFRPMPRDPALVRSLGLDPSAPILGAVARLTEQKGIDTLVTAAAEVQRTVTDAQFLLVGSGPLEGTLREQAAATGARVVFAGERRNVPEILGLLDIAVVPSRWEGAFCFSLLEAMASRTPVVCSDIPVFTDVVSPGASATVFSVDDPSDLARALLSMLQEPERAQRTAEAGLRLVRERFSSERSSRATVGVYERLLGGEPS